MSPSASLILASSMVSRALGTSTYICMREARAALDDCKDCVDTRTCVRYPKQKDVICYPGAKVRVIARNYGVITRKSRAFSRVNTPFNAHFTPKYAYFTP